MLKADEELVITEQAEFLVSGVNHFLIEMDDTNGNMSVYCMK